MTSIEEIMKFQKEFNRKRNWVTGDATGEQFMKDLQYATIALTGEAGEFANILKKILREEKHAGDIDENRLADMREELIDVFIYVVILSLILKVDIPKEYFDKMKKNEERFKKYLK